MDKDSIELRRQVLLDLKRMAHKRRGKALAEKFAPKPKPVEPAPVEAASSPEADEDDDSLLELLGG